jgi:ABC-type glycerol-3-phosphate transport system substrate-binding protein
MKGLLRSLMLVAGLAACSGGSADPASQATASASEGEDDTVFSGFSDSDTAAMRPETERSRAVLWRLKGSTMEHRLRN